MHFDGRIRLTGGFDTGTADFGNDQTIARGYMNGREYDLRSFWVKHKGESWDFAFGRLIVNEADATRLDGMRLWWRMSKHWDASLYAGGYPDPYSRSLFDDYRVKSTYTTDFAFAGGADATYTYDKIWGSFSVSGAYFHGNNDGGPLSATQLAMGGSPGTFTTETPRVWITWTDFVRIFSWMDLYTDLVLDATGSAGTQLTRLDAMLSIRGGKHLTLRFSYDHMSALAIEMWLTRLLYDRTVHTANTIENALIVERTARDEARGQVDLTFGKFSVYGEGRFRRRAIVTLSDDPQFLNTAGQQVTPGLAYDGTLGLRDRGSLAGLRLGLWATYIADYRAKNFIAAFEFGRSWFEERLSIDLSFLYAKTNDQLAGGGMNGLPIACVPFPYAPTATQALAANNTCYGTRDGSEYEFGFTLAGEPFAHWYAFLDYRLVADTTNGNLIAGSPTANPPVAATPQPTILTHVLMFLIEARY
jgi:hypothetical protein